MTKLIFNTADSRAATTEFKDTIAANGARQWMDRYGVIKTNKKTCLLYTSPSPRDYAASRMPSSA